MFGFVFLLLFIVVPGFNTDTIFQKHIWILSAHRKCFLWPKINISCGSLSVVAVSFHYLLMIFTVRFIHSRGNRNRASEACNGSENNLTLDYYTTAVPPTLFYNTVHVVLHVVVHRCFFFQIYHYYQHLHKNLCRFTGHFGLQIKSSIFSVDFCVAFHNETTLNVFVYSSISTMQKNE